MWDVKGTFRILNLLPHLMTNSSYLHIKNTTSVDRVFSVDIVYTVTIDMVDTVDTLYTIQTALHCTAHSSLAGWTDLTEIANMGYVFDGVAQPDWADWDNRGEGTDGTEMPLRMIMIAWVIRSWKI